MKRPLSTFIFFFLVTVCFSQVEVRSTSSERRQQHEVKKFVYRTGAGLGYNQLKNTNSNFGFELFLSLTNEIELYERIRLGGVVAGTLADVNQTVFLNDGSRFDTDGAPKGGFVGPYAAIVVYKSQRFRVAPQIGYQWHFFSTEDINRTEPVQSFYARGMDYALVFDYNLNRASENSRNRTVRVLLNYSQLKINGQPAALQLYGLSAHLGLNLFERGRR